jgi:flagellar hook-associated protein 3 FlgL
MSDFISTLGLQQINITNLVTGQSSLSLLNTQLATGKKSESLTDYSSGDAQKLMNLSTSIAQRQGFLGVTNNINLRLKAYDEALTGIEDIAALANTAALNTSTYNPEQNGSLASQIEGTMQQITYFLDQKVGDRYIFAGSRFNTVPVGDITALPVPPTETSDVTTGTVLPSYDTNYDPNNPNAQVPEAYVKDSVAIDTIQKLTYGVTSTQEGFQQLIMGLRWVYAATQDPANYEANVTKGRDLITQGLSNIRAIHTDVANAMTTLTTTSDLHTRMIDNLSGQIDNIQGVDLNEVAVKITTYQAQLEASYAATARMTNLSILKYL